MRRKVVLVEVNEVPFEIWDRYATKRPKSAVARLLKESVQRTTVTEDEGFVSRGTEHTYPQLTPWCTWPTLHRGVPNTSHTILDIGQDLTGPNTEFPPIWEIAADAGRRVGVCGSLHSSPIPNQPKNYAFYIPDPFAMSSETIPSDFEAFQAFSLGATQASGRNVDSGIDANRAIRAVLSLPRLGLRPSTVARIVRQLLSERRTPERVVRRRVIQTELNYDLFRKALKQEQPDLSLFFSNHVAAAMHRYWAAAYPNDFDGADVDADWVDAYGGEIDHAMDSIDAILDDLLTFCDENRQFDLMVLSSMGQAPTRLKRVTHELGVVDPNLLMASLGAPQDSWRWTNAMAPNFNVFVDEPYLETVIERLDDMLIDDEPIDYRRAPNGFVSMDFGQQNLHHPKVTLDGVTASAGTFGLQNVEIQDLSMKCADHIPQGSWFTRSPDSGPDASRSEVSSCAVAPTVLRALGLPLPEYMREPVTV